MQFSVAATLFTLVASAAAYPAGIFPRQLNGTSLCGNQTYAPSQYACYNTNLLCPIVNGTTHVACGSDPATFSCYSPNQYHCVNATLVQGAVPSATGVPLSTATGMARLRY